MAQDNNLRAVRYRDGSRCVFSVPEGTAPERIEAEGLPIAFEERGCWFLLPFGFAQFGVVRAKNARRVAVTGHVAHRLEALEIHRRGTASAVPSPEQLPTVDEIRERNRARADARPALPLTYAHAARYTLEITPSGWRAFLDAGIRELPGEWTTLGVKSPPTCEVTADQLAAVLDAAVPLRDLIAVRPVVPVVDQMPGTATVEPKRRGKRAAKAVRP